MSFCVSTIWFRKYDELLIKEESDEKKLDELDTRTDLEVSRAAIPCTLSTRPTKPAIGFAEDDKMERDIEYVYSGRIGRLDVF